MDSLLFMPQVKLPFMKSPPLILWAPKNISSSCQTKLLSCQMDGKSVWCAPRFLPKPAAPTGTIALSMAERSEKKLTNQYVANLSLRPRIWIGHFRAVQFTGIWGQRVCRCVLHKYKREFVWEIYFKCFYASWFFLVLIACQRFFELLFHVKLNT